jgi:uncharacterized protein with HEPN domain
MRPETAKRLIDALAACEAIASFTAGLDLAGFSGNALVRSAVERQFEIIGEALGKAAREDESLVKSMPDIPRIVGLRNRLIHGYDSVDDQLVWDVIRSKLPSLTAALRRQLGAQRP